MSPSNFFSTRLISRTFVIALVAVALATNTLTLLGQSDPVERPRTQDMLPETTVLFVQVDNIRDLIAKSQEANMGKLMADEAIAPLIEDLWGQAKSAYAEYEDQIGVSLEDLQSIPAGEMTFAIIVPRRKDPEFMLILQTDPESGAVDRVMERGREVVREEGEEIEAETTDDGIEFESFNVDDKRVKFFRKDGLVVAGTSEDELDQFVDRWMGREVEKTRPLSQNRKFVTIMNRCQGANETQPEVRFFADPIALVKASTRGNAGVQMAINFLPVFGLDGLLGIGGSSFVDEDDFNSISHGHILLAEPRKGVFEMLAFRPTNYEPEPWLPHDTSNLFTTSWDVDQMMVELTKIIETFQGEGVVDKFFVENADKYFEFDVREEFLGNLTGRVTYTQWLEPPVRLNSQQNVVALEVKDPAAMEATLEKVMARVNRDRPDDEKPEDNPNRWVTVEHKGIQIFGPSEEGMNKRFAEQRERQRQRREERGQQRAVDIEISAPTPSFAVVGNYLLLSQSRPYVRHAIETDQGDVESLAASESYQRLATQMTRLLKSDMPSGMMYSDPRQVFRWMLELANSENSQAMITEQAANNKYVGGIKEALDKNPLPDFSKIEHYIAPSGGFMTSDETGLHFLAFEMKAEE